MPIRLVQVNYRVGATGGQRAERGRVAAAADHPPAAPSCLAICTASLPENPVAPFTSTVSPG